MRLVLVGAVDIRNSDATLLLGAALERAGCSVQILPVTTELPLLAEIGFAGGQAGDRAYQLALSRKLLRLADHCRADAVLLYGSNWCVLPKAIRALQRRGCRVALWEVNNWVFGGIGSASLPLYDHVFVLDSYFVPVLRVAGARRVQHLGACADPSEHEPTAVSDQERQWYGAEVAFVGTRSDERVRMLGALAHTDLRIYGTGWTDAGPPLDAYVRTEPVYGPKKNKIYTHSRLSLNVHQPHMVHGENFRVFEVAACGGVSVSIAKPDLVQALEPGREVVVFDSPDDLCRKVKTLLDHPDRRDEMAAAGRARVLAEHTYDHRARTILEAVC